MVSNLRTSRRQLLMGAGGLALAASGVGQSALAGPLRQDGEGTDVEPFTYIGGLFDRATGSAPFNLAPQWAEAQERVDGDVVYNYVTTNDIIGGNSGSPVINARGEVIGAAFDGNIHSLGGAFGYDGELNRTVVVSTAAVTEALRNVYGRTALLEELGQ